MWALAPFEALAPRICAWMIKKGRENVCVKGGCTCSESICGNVMWVRCALLRGACAEYMYFGSMSANSALRGACAESLCTSTPKYVGEYCSALRGACAAIMYYTPKYILSACAESMYVHTEGNCTESVCLHTLELFVVIVPLFHCSIIVSIVPA